jgi:hypothetical protein
MYERAAAKRILLRAHCSRNSSAPFFWRWQRIGYNHLSRRKIERMNALSPFVSFNMPEGRP